MPDALPIGKRLSRPEGGDSLHRPPPPRARGGASVVFAAAGDGRLFVSGHRKSKRQVELTLLAESLIFRLVEEI